MTTRKTAYRQAMEIAEIADKAGEPPYELVGRLYAAGLITTNTESDRLAGEPYQWGRRGRATDQDDTEQQEKEAMAVTNEESDLIKHEDGRILITHGIDENGELLFYVDIQGEMTFLQAIGLLEAAKDNVRDLYLGGNEA
ncbi:hypothetical protein [Corynebacterium macclintockiae]|uniref:hypothetical protein n=1 Tax=Corynebacterium macclintockiae TaxID=2913501 RepID=UPI003EBA0B8C